MSTASRQEHDKYFPPRGARETATVFLYRALREHRQSHVDWQQWCMEHPGDTVSDGTDADYQQRAVERYDEMLAAQEELAGAIDAARRYCRICDEVRGDDSEVALSLRRNAFLQMAAALERWSVQPIH